ncbi:MAG: toprim domain-containing protein, partial [Anaerolineales bacterium]|nr:toprim domain-containing protein [Anaerolineales bacterium]
MDVIPELLRVAAAGGEIVLALDSDQAGKQAARQLAASLVSGGIAPTRIRLFDWPAKDANEYLLKGGEACVVMQRMKDSSLWLEMMIAAAAPGEWSERNDEDAVQALFRALARLSTFELSRYRELTCQRLKLRKSVFDNLLQSVRLESKVSGNGDCRYLVHAGHLVQRTHDAAGNQILNPLCNFTAWIEQDVLHDNGQDVERVLHIGGRLNNVRLPQARVKASEFARLDWVLRAWGSAAIIEPGSQRREHLRAAIQHLSRGVQQKCVYTHTGWLNSAQGRVYLSSGGAVTASSCVTNNCAGAAGMEDRAGGRAGWDGVVGEPLRIADSLQDQGVGGNVVGETEGISGQDSGMDGRDGDCGVTGVPGEPTMNGGESSFDFGKAGRIDGGDSGMDGRYGRCGRDGDCGVVGMPVAPYTHRLKAQLTSSR